MEVSFIVPVYNVEQYIRPSLDSILNQTHRDIEVILVDDGSTDRSGAICDEYGARDSRVRVIHKENEGAGYARNTGMDAASGEYLYFCDPDDLVHPRLVEDNYKLGKEHDADLVTFGFKTISTDLDGKECVVNYIPALSGVYDYAGFWEYFREGGRERGFMCYNMFKRTFIMEHNLRQKNFKNSEDAYFIFEIYGIPFHNVVYNQGIYYTYIKRQGSATASYNPNRIEEEYLVSRKFDEVVRNSPYAKGRYEDMIQFKYVMSFSLAVGNLTRGGRDISTREKVQTVKQMLSRDGLRQAIKAVPLRAFDERKTKCKVLFLKLRLYRLVIWMGAGYDLVGKVLGV